MATKEEEKYTPETEEANTDKVIPDADSEVQDRSQAGDNTEGEEDPEAKLETSEKAAEEAYDRFLRVSADFENFKKRSARELADFRKYANEALIREMLPVVDNLERAIASMVDNASASSFIEGVDLTLKEILKVFEKCVVKPIDAIGKPFDPTFHQAVMQREADDKPENTVLEELQKGYTIHDRLLRPTMVVVSKTAAKEDNENPDLPQEDD